MDLDCLFPPGTGGMEAHLELFSVIFAVGSEEMLRVCIYLCPLHLPCLSYNSCLLHAACGALENGKYSGNMLRPQTPQPALGGIFDLLFWALVGRIILPQHIGRLCR